MYILAPWKKDDPVVRRNLPDRIFFGHGACHILAGVYLKENVDSSFKPWCIKPARHPGIHVFASDGHIAFDHRGYSVLDRLEKHHRKVWTHQFSDWTAELEPVDYDLLDTAALNQRGMRGPDQYLGDPVTRARAYLHRIDHGVAAARARQLADSMS